MASLTTRRAAVAFVWAYIGPYHADRCEAVRTRFGDQLDVLGVEVSAGSQTYAWTRIDEPANWSRVTLVRSRAAEDVSWWARLWRLLPALRRCKWVFLCGYERVENILLSWILPFIGIKVFLMTESKFDDRRRSAFVEFLKMLAVARYSGALVGGNRHLEYMKFLGFHRRTVALGYDTVGLARMRDGTSLEAAETAYEDRKFLFVGRLVEKKNVFLLLDSYDLYRKIVAAPRGLVLVGGGELESEIKDRIEALALGEYVSMPGFLQAVDIAEFMRDALALVLPSREEQWGLVVNEAMAFDLPIVISESCGARDLLVRQFVNGFVVEPENAMGLARSLAAIGEDRDLWNSMRVQSRRLSLAGDTVEFAAGVSSLIKLDS